MNLLGNSGYGGLIMDKSKHTDIQYVDEKIKLSQTANKPLFKHYIDIGEGMFEVEMAKSIIKLDLAIQLGFQVLQLAKLRMLSFYYDFLVSHVPLENSN